MNNQPSNQDLMDAIVGVSGKVGGLESKVGGLESKVGGLESEISNLRADIPNMIVDGIGTALEQMVFPRFVEMEERFDAADRRFERIEARLAETVTIDQLDRRLLALKDELKDTGARAIRKVTHLAQILHANNALSAAQVVEVGRA